MAGETPGRGAVQAGSGEGVEAQFRGAGMDVVSDGLQGSEVLDLVNGVAGLFQQSLVDNDAVGFEAVADGLQLASLIVEVELVGGQLTGDSGAGQIQSVVVPVGQAGHIADVVDGGSLGLGHLSGQGVGIGAGSGGDDLDGDAGGLCVELGQLLHGAVGFGLEVQVVDAALSSGGSSLGGSGCCVGSGGSLSSGRGGRTAAGSQAQNHNQSQQHSNQLFHYVSSYCFAG